MFIWNTLKLIKIHVFTRYFLSKCISQQQNSRRNRTSLSLLVVFSMWCNCMHSLYNKSSIMSTCSKEQCTYHYIFICDRHCQWKSATHKKNPQNTTWRVGKTTQTIARDRGTWNKHIISKYHNIINKLWGYCEPLIMIAFMWSIKSVYSVQARAFLMRCELYTP